MLDALDAPPTGLFWSAPLALDSDFTAEDPLALDYLGQQVGLWLFPGFTTRTSRAQYCEGPSLFLRGERSDYLTARHEPCIHALFPSASIAIIAAAGHWLRAEQPAAVTARIAQFLDEAATGCGAASRSPAGSGARHSAPLPRWRGISTPCHAKRH